MKRLLLLFLSFLFFWGIASSNNVRFESSARIINVDSDGIATIELGLKWDNAWRDYNNWDGVWLFLKYREGETGAWKHVNLETSGHTFVDTSANVNKYTYHVGKKSDEPTKATGLFVVLAENAYANPRLKCRLKWKLPDGLTKKDFDDVNSVIYAHGLEMVYVRTGSYSLGQKLTEGTFDSTYINSEEGLTVKISTDDGFKSESLSSTYPKGFAGFYSMKYELGQEQFIRFFNSLSKVQQEELIPSIKTFAVDNSIFGKIPAVATKRNGITLVTKSIDEKPYLLACNLNRDNQKNADDDGQNIPCGFMNVNFLNAYCSWSGLRPMSEMEFEKSCRRPSPFITVPNEYVWGSTSSPILLTEPVAATVNTSSEIPKEGNVNSANLNGVSLFGNPIRSGSFSAVANSSTNALDYQYLTGSTYWGLMEMGGNLKEIVVSVKNTEFRGDKHGFGAYDKSFWHNAGHEKPFFYGYRGGGFESDISRLRTTDRSDMGAVTAYYEDETDDVGFVGFRAVRSFSCDETGMSISGGSIAPHNICSGRDIHIIEETPASLTGGGDEQAIFTYEWYMDSILVKDFSASEYVIRSAVLGKRYTVLRRAICQYGVDSASCVFTIPKITLERDTCVVGLVDSDLNTIEISLGDGVTNEVVFDWYYNGKWVHDGEVYTPHHNTFSGNTGFLKLSYRATLADCPALFEGTVTVYNACSDSVVYDDDNKIYPTVVGSNGTNKVRPYQCWMAENLNAGTKENIHGDYWKFDEPGIQKWCYSNHEPYCDTYGALYEWWEVVCDGFCDGKVTNANVNVNSETELAAYGAKMVPGSNTLVQGICPDDWRLPTKVEQAALRTIQSGFNAKSSGWRDDYGLGFKNLGVEGLWWASTPYGGGNGWRVNFGASPPVGSTLGIRHEHRSYGFSVRCVQN